MNIELHLLLMPVAGLILFVLVRVFAPISEANRLIAAVPGQPGQLDVWYSMLQSKRCNISVVDESGRQHNSSARCVSASKANFQYNGPASFHFHPANDSKLAVKAADCVMLISLR